MNASAPNEDHDQRFKTIEMELFPSYASPVSAAQAMTTAALTTNNTGSNKNHTSAAGQQPQVESSSACETRSGRVLIVEAFGHVVDINRFHVFPLARGSDSVQIRFTRAAMSDGRQRAAMFRSVAQTVLHLCRIVPRGVVVFFPSFALEAAFFDVLRGPSSQGGRRSFLAQIEDTKKCFREGGCSETSSSTSAKPQQSQFGDALFTEYSEHIDRVSKSHPDDRAPGRPGQPRQGRAARQGAPRDADLPGVAHGREP